MIDETKYMVKCLKFEYCSVPKCPLDPLIDRRVSYKDEPKCNTKPLTRYKIGKNSGLPYKGLTKYEYSQAILGGKQWQWFIK